jgi:hypothetical protein
VCVYVCVLLDKNWKSIADVKHFMPMVKIRSKCDAREFSSEHFDLVSNPSIGSFMLENTQSTDRKSNRAMACWNDRKALLHYFHSHLVEQGRSREARTRGHDNMLIMGNEG